MTVEYGVFNDEGCIEAGFWTLDGAEKRAATLRTNWERGGVDFARNDATGEYEAESDNRAQAAEICPEHEEQPLDGCEECATDEGPEDEDL